MATETDKDPLDVDAAIDALNHALPMQYRSAVAYTVAAGSLTGFEFAGLGEQLWSFARAELEDARRIVEKVVALGGTPAVEVAEVASHNAPADAVSWLIEAESEVIEALQDVIPSTGHTGRSEALEHRLEHTIMRKQEQVEALVRARGPV